MTPKKPPPLGTDVAFAVPGGGGKPWNLTYWDVWFALVAEADFGGSLDCLAARMKEKNRRDVYWDRDSLERTLAHLRDFQRRLLEANVSVTDVVSKAGDLARSEARRARNYILEKPAGEREWSDAIRHLPRRWRYAQALRGHWPRFPVSPEPYAEKMRSRFKMNGFYTEGQSFKVARRLDGFVERARKLLAADRYDRAQAFLRAWMTVVIDVIEMTDDSCGCIGDSFGEGFRIYLEIDLHKTGIEDRVFFPDLLDFLIWEDYGLTDDVIEGYFRRLTPAQGDVCIEYLRPQVEELRADDLDYQSEGALTLLGQVVAEQARFDQFTELARQMGSREWRRIVRLVDRAMKKRKRALAMEVFEAALTPGCHSDFLNKKYQQLKLGKWDPDPRK
jgi:hypothetical protein